MITLRQEDTDPEKNHHNEYFYAGGLVEYVRWLNTDNKLLHDVVGFRKEMDGITVDVAFQWCSDAYSDTMLGYANSIRTIDGTKASLTRTLNSLGKKSKITRLNIDQLRSWDFRFHLCLSGNQFQTFVDPSIFEGNPGLSWCPLPTGCQDNEEAPQVPSGDGGEDDDSKLEKLQFVISMVGFCAGFWGVFGTLAMKRCWRYAYFQFLEKVKDAVLDFVLAISTYLQKRS